MRRDQAALSDNRRLAEQNPERANLRSVLEKSYAIRAKHPDDPEIARTVSEIELVVKNVAQVEDLSQLQQVEPALTGTGGWRATMVQAAVPVSPRASEKKRPQLVDKPRETTQAVKPPARHEYNAQTFIRELGILAKEVRRRLLVLARPGGKWSVARVGTAAGVVVLLPLAVYFAFHFPGAGKRDAQPQLPVTVTISTDPPDSTVMSEGAPIANGGVAIGKTIEVSRLGYKPRQIQIQNDSDARVVLEPESMRLSVHASGNGGSAELDGRKIASFTDGSLEYDVTPDGTPHKLTVTGADGKQLFTMNAQILPGQQPQITSFDGKDILAVTSLGNHATLYGASTLGNARIGADSTAISPSGAPVTLADQNHDVVFGQGDNQGSVSIEILNAPALMVQSLSGDGRVFITTNADKAVLSVDGAPVPRQNRGWTVSKTPGAHKFTLSADGYEPQAWTMTMPRRGVLNKAIKMQPKAVTPTKAGLNITAGPPGAEIALDGTKVGELDSAGNLYLPNMVSLGKHKVGLTKPGYEARDFEIMISPSAPGKPLADAQIPKPVLSPSLGTLAFDATTKGVAVRYRHVGDAQFREANPSEKLQLPPGQYEIVAEAAGYQRFTTTVNVGKEDVTVPLNLAGIPDYEFEDPKQVTHEGAWLKSKVPGKFINLKPGLMHENVVFARPGKTLFWDKKVDWIIEDPAHHARVQYSLEGQSGKLTRKLVVGQDTSNQKEAKVDAQSAGQKDSLSLHIRVEGGRIRIADDKGTVLDEFTAPSQDFSTGRIAIRSDSLFLVRSDNQ